jgi:flagellar protein FliJ
MTRTPLRTLLRVRRASLDDAQKEVAERYRAEQEAGRRAEAAGEALSQEMRTALDPATGDDAVERFARWLPLGRAALQRAHADHQAATAELDRARAVLGLARAAVRTVELTIEKRDAELARERQRREQLAADEAGSRRGRSGAARSGTDAAPHLVRHHPDTRPDAGHGDLAADPRADRTPPVPEQGELVSAAS